MKIIDLSKTIEYNANDPHFMQVKIRNKPHGQAKWLIRLLGLPFRLFPKNFSGWADDCIQKMGVHATTHMDAPWHYSPTCNGYAAKPINEVPLEWCFGPGIVIDMTHKAECDPITIQDLETFLERENLVLEEGMIVLIKTGRDRFMGTKQFPYKGTGMSAVSTEWLIKQGIRVMGIDQWGWDLPLPHLIEQAKKSNNAKLFWEAHLVGATHEYCHMEQLTNLDALPVSGFQVAAFPLKIKGASAAPARVVAILDN